VAKKLVLGIEGQMKQHHVTVINGEAFIKGRGEAGIEVTCAGENYTGKHLLICTGSEAVVPPIPGLAEAGDVVVTNRELLSLTSLPASLVIIGGGVIVWNLPVFFIHWAQVTVVEMLPEILNGLDQEISAMLRDIYTQKRHYFLPAV
jgi:dihydrolipoamide dehydrogenase